MLWFLASLRNEDDRSSTANLRNTIHFPQMLPLVSDNFTFLGELRSVPRLLQETSLPFQGPGAGNSALFEAGIERIEIYAGRKEQFKKNAYSVYEREGGS
ncbi:hypothetical protein CEXT_783351 [Caerostris extrusa]|uniref:Uncharacterized protein n=1 Tax=Caerostris extrusa TaxID=172846 RepID=A0AAV4MT05_CAEEX|nr:hypothetical protein CEXT_783351 [Caerostris extrusa]